MKKKKILGILLTIILIIQQNSFSYATSSSDEDSDEQTSVRKSLEKSKISDSDNKKDESSEEEDQVSFLTVGEGSHNHIFISGLRPKSELSPESYAAMLEEMYSEVSKFIKNGWLSHNINKYKGFTFVNADFNRTLLEDVGNKLKVYSHLKPTTHFFECRFDTKKLRSVLCTKAEFSKKSTFLKSTEGKNNDPIPNSKT